LPKNTSKKNNRRSLFQWHRQIGLAVSLLVIILSITGIFLNHTEKFELDSQYIKSKFLLDWYDIKKPTIKSFPVEKNWISHLGDKVYFNDVLVAKEISIVTGAVSVEEFIAVATQTDVILLTPTGEKIEQLDATTGVPANITAIGINHFKQLTLKAQSNIYVANNDVTEWKQSNDTNIIWATTAKLTPAIENSLNKLYIGKGLSKERVLLDIHSGRILGKAGPLLMDLSAVLLLVLSFTGCWMYAKRTWAIYKRDKLLAAASIGESYSAADLKRGEEGVILTVIGDEKLKQRLASMGVLAGTIIATPTSSVFNDPRTYIIRGYQLCMRTTEASMILLQTDTQTIPRLQKYSHDGCSTDENETSTIDKTQS